ncbi:MAG: hypothetical protein KatS3mg099_235 [Candidatus Parcubacteria bacterium]|nr:MAG: hypothetical protein KatS3mg099_235 [Candidatus Parcubacteria bacterium]
MRIPSCHAKPHKKTTLRRFVAGALVMMLIFASFPASPRAHAIVARSVEVGPPLLTTSTIETVADTTETAKETLIDTIAYTVINAIIVAIVRNIILKAVEQVEGIPDSASFVTDLKGLMRTLADRGVNAALIDAGFDPYAPGVGESWCNPFGGGGGGGSGGGGGGGDDDGGFVDKAQQEVQKQVRQAIQRILDQYELQRGSASRRIRCSLITYSNDPRAFISGDFSQGGLAAWFAYVRDSNPIALRFQLEDEISRRIAEEQGTEQTLLSWNQGFFSPPDLNACYGDGGILLSITANEPPLSDCLRVSPGSIIKDQLERVLGMNLDRLANADEINEFIGAAVTLLIDQLFQGGGLLGANKTGEGGKSFLEKLEEEENNANAGRAGLLRAIDEKIREVEFLADAACKGGGSGNDEDMWVSDEWREVRPGETIAVFSREEPNFAQLRVTPREVVTEGRAAGGRFDAQTLQIMGIAQGELQDQKDGNGEYKQFRGDGDWTASATFASLELDGVISLSDNTAVWKRTNGEETVLSTRQKDDNKRWFWPRVSVSRFGGASPSLEDHILTALLNAVLQKHFRDTGTFETRFVDHNQLQ